MTSQFNARAGAVWGKSDASTDDWLPLVTHLQDAAAIAGHIWHDWVPQAVRRTVAQTFGCSDDEARVLYCWLTGLHDIGKATPAFAAKVPALLARMADYGLSTDATMRESARLPHGLAGQRILTDWMHSQGADRRVPKTYAVVVGGHHGVPPEDHQLLTIEPRLLGTGAWSEVQTEIIEAITTQTGAHRYLDGWLARPLPPTVQALMTGLVIVADWLSSDSTRFPYGEHRLSTHRALDAWADVALSYPWEAEAPPRDVTCHLTQRFPVIARHGARPAQVALVEAAWNMTDPGLLILEAAMGNGKTEGALAAAEVLAYRFGCGGVFVALPTMATSDAMFTRIRAWMDALPSTSGADASVHLAHSKAHLNPEYEHLRKPQYANVFSENNESADAQGREVTAVVDSWLRGRKKGVLASFVVGTIDQVLYGALKVRHLALRHLALAGKVVIIDEVHAADAYMRQYLCRVLEWLGAYRTPVILLSATLPAKFRQEFVTAYENGAHRVLGRRDALTPLPQNAAYPVVTCVDSQRSWLTPVTDSAPQQHVSLSRISDDDVALVHELTSSLADGGCVAVIRNTVSRAQATYQLLQPHFGDDVTLLHSRFVAPHRAAKQARLSAELGPPGGDRQRPVRRIVVATQVVEQSLDLDFDLMITDLAPVDLMLQRIGRLHRHIRPRPPLLSEPRCVVTGADWTSEPPTPVPGSVAVYRSANLLRAAAVLETRWSGKPLDLPSEIPHLVAAAHAEGATGPTSWCEAIAEADAKEFVVVAKSVRDAEAFLLGNVPGPKKSLTGWLHASARDDETSARQQVRDSEDGIEVIVVQRIRDELRLLPDLSGAPGPVVPALFGQPDEPVARKAASFTVRLPQSLTRWERGDRIIRQLERETPQAWQESRWLQGELALCLDENLQAVLNDVVVSYDLTLGLIQVPHDQDARSR